MDDSTIRVNLTNTTTLLSIIDNSEDVIMAKVVGNDSVIFTAPLKLMVVDAWMIMKMISYPLHYTSFR